MKRLGLILAAALALAALYDPTPAEAYTVRVCAPARPGVALGPARVTAPTSGTAYSTDARGCALISATDVADFRAMGYLLESPYQTVVAKGLTAASTVVLPPSTFIQQIIVEEDSGGTMTGGIRIGTQANGTEVMLATAVAANSLATVEDTSMGTRAFSRTLPQTLHISSSGSFGYGQVNVTVVYGFF